MKIQALAPLCVLLLLFLPGCAGCSCVGTESTMIHDRPAAIPPQITDISIPPWPPVGASTQVSASASDQDGNLTRIVFDFDHLVTRSTSSGSYATVSATGAELGEGYGTLYVTAFDLDGAWADQAVSDFLVDLTPPKAELITDMVRWGEGQDLAVLVADGWVLGGVEITFGGVSKKLVFEEGYPSTLGVTWDTSVVTFATEDFPEISGTVKLRVWDAAGNETTTELELTLDGTPPDVAIESPPAGSALGGLATIEVSGADETGEPVEIDVYVAGTPVATLPGPSGKVSVDLTEMAKGPAQIEAIARDAAGNESEVAAVEVVIE